MARFRSGFISPRPGVAIRRDDAIDQLAKGRMSTVYMPGDKITMLPDQLVQEYTLAEGQTRPALSLYAVLKREDFSVVSTTTRAELVPIASNLRHNDLDHLVTEQNLADGAGEYPYKTELGLLWQWAQVLEQGRMAKRAAFGLRPEQNNRVDFNFYVEDDVVSIVRRKRGAPLDKIVAELMIFANSTWGKLMHDHGVPGIYRSQGTGWGGKMQVRMVTHAAPHQGLGVDQYAWSTSPLRRYPDLVNQWQILACIAHGVTAPAGRAVQTERRHPVCAGIKLRCRLRRLCRFSGQYGALLVPALAGTARRARRRAAWHAPTGSGGVKGRSGTAGRFAAGAEIAGHGNRRRVARRYGSIYCLGMSLI